MHGSAVGTATPKQPKNSGIQWERVQFCSAFQKCCGRCRISGIFIVCACFHALLSVVLWTFMLHVSMFEKRSLFAWQPFWVFH